MPEQTLADCVKSFEARFASVREDTASSPCRYLCGGGERDEDEPFPALYSSPELAVTEWKRAAAALPNKKKTALIWRERPHLEMFIMTMQDAMGTQRVVTNRYVVIARYALAE